MVEPESQLNMIGSDVLIKCSASGTPRPTVTWRVNGAPLHGQCHDGLILRSHPFYPERLVSVIEENEQIENTVMLLHVRADDFCFVPATHR